MRARWMAVVGVLAAAACDRESVEPFADLDQDGDSRISRDEARADPGLDADFGHVDSDGDGELSAREYLQAATGTH